MNEKMIRRFQLLISMVKQTFLVTQMVKNLPAVQETQVWSLSWEDPLEKGMATHSSILAWRIPWTENPGRLQSMGSQRIGHDWATNTHTHYYTYYNYLGENRMRSWPLNLLISGQTHCRVSLNSAKVNLLLRF